MSENVSAHTALHVGSTLDSVGGFDVIECTTCGFAHIVPIPTADDLSSVYKDDYYTTEKPLYLEQHAEDKEWWQMVYAERYDLFEEMLPTEGRTLLDVGSGPGYFLAEGARRGWSVTGIEPSLAASEHARSMGLDVVQGFLGSDTAPALGMFDVIHMSEVLEHIPDPGEMIRLLRSMLNPGGLLYVMVPNEYSPFQEALRDGCGFDPWWVSPPHHVNYFNRDSLAGLMRSADFEVVHSDATFPIDMFLLMGENYVGDDATGRRCHALRKNFEFNLAKAGKTQLKKDLYSSLAELGLGRLVGVLGRAAD